LYKILLYILRSQVGSVKWETGQWETGQIGRAKNWNISLYGFAGIISRRKRIESMNPVTSAGILRICADLCVLSIVFVSSNLYDYIRISLV